MATIGFMADPRTAEYGFWKSPITSDLIVADALRLGSVALEGDSVYWSEGRPAEKGRTVVTHREVGGQIRDATPAGFNARTRVHEYGGGSFVVDQGVVYASDFRDQRLYRIDAAGNAEPLSPEGAWRYADGRIDRTRGRIYCVREDHTVDGAEAVNTIVAVDLNGVREPEVLVRGRDFYSNPRLSADGSRLCWLEWSHPNMPWDRTELWVGTLDASGRPSSKQVAAGGPSESIFQPEWAPDGRLYFISDRGGWWNLYRWDGEAVEPVVEIQAEMGLPQWLFGWSTYGFESADSAICSYFMPDGWRLARVDLKTKQLNEIETPYTDISEVRVGGGKVFFNGGSPAEPSSIVELDLASGAIEVLRRSAEIPNELRPYISSPEAVEFPTEEGLTAHAHFYPPKNPDFQAPEGALAPLLVTCHGGPTGHSANTLDLRAQYWTSRGIGYLDVNYGGSTGFGRAYRERLAGKWGVVDLDDCANAARFIAERGDADPRRLMIRGGSAGGYTTLAALAFRDVFAVGASYYGVSDMEALARDTHKFESRYLDKLVGPYPEAAEVYRGRSPIHAAESVDVPVIFFQGSDDEVVPPDQTEVMVGALRGKGLPVGYLLFEGESHGFRMADNIKRALDAELYFYASVLFGKGLRF